MSTSVATGIRAGLEAQRKATPRAAERVVISGFDTAAGQAIAEALARRGARLVLQSHAADDAVAMAAGRLAAKAMSVSLLNIRGSSRADAIADAQTALGTLGGADAVIVVVPIDQDALRGVGATRDGEQALGTILARPIETIRITANRMRVTWTEGTVVAVFVLPEGLSTRGELLARLLKSQMAGVVRGEAERHADNGIVVVAVSAMKSNEPNPGCVPELAELVAELLGGPADRLSGVVYEAVLSA